MFAGVDPSGWKGRPAGVQWAHRPGPPALTPRDLPVTEADDKESTHGGARGRDNPWDSATGGATGDATGSATAVASADDGERQQQDARRSGWGQAKSILTAVKTASKFHTLRDLMGTDAYIDPSRMVKALGEGAFAKVQQAELQTAAAGEASSGTAHGGGKGSRGGTACSRNSGGGGGGGVKVVAVKTLRKELLEDPGQVQLFVREVSLLRKLRHRHIVEFIGCSWQRSTGGMDDSVKAGAAPKVEEMFYVQEYCAGGSLSDLVRCQMTQPFKRLYSDADALRWSLQVAMALQYLHESRPVTLHRDLKIDNVMLTSADVAQADAKLADFGLARLLRPEEKEKMEQLNKLLSQPQREWDASLRTSSKKMLALLDSRLREAAAEPPNGGSRAAGSSHSEPGSRLSACASTVSAVSCWRLTGRTGSFGYMAPEVSRGMQYNAQADIFSLGMCMHCLFCRTIPTLQLALGGDESHLELYAAQLAEGYRPPLLPGLLPSVRQAIEACWQGDPKARPTARGVVEMLQRLQDSGEVDAPGASSRSESCACCTQM